MRNFLGTWKTSVISTTSRNTRRRTRKSLWTLTIKSNRPFSELAARNNPRQRISIKSPSMDTRLKLSNQHGRLTKIPLMTQLTVLWQRDSKSRSRMTRLSKKWEAHKWMATKGPNRAWMIPWTTHFSAKMLTWIQKIKAERKAMTLTKRVRAVEAGSKMTNKHSDRLLPNIRYHNFNFNIKNTFW